MSRFEAFDKKLNVVVKNIYLMIRQKILFEEGHTGTSVSLSATTNGRVPPDAIDWSLVGCRVARFSQREMRKQQPAITLASPFTGSALS